MIDRMNDLSERITQGYATLAETTSELNRKTELLIQCQIALDWGQKGLLVLDKVEGKNAETRAANLSIALQDLVKSTQAAETHVRDAKLHRDLAQLIVDELRLQVRLLELGKEINHVE